MSSSIIFVSSQISDRRQNAINDFEIDIKPEIDARSGKKEIVVEEVIYPNTISTIHPRNKEHFKFKFGMIFKHFIHHKTAGFKNSVLGVIHDWIYIPYGHHSLRDLIIYINKHLNIAGCEINRVMGQKCTITFNKNFEVFSTASNSFDGYTNNVHMSKQSNRNQNKDQFDVKVEIEFEDGLTHVLGLKNVVEFYFNHSNLKSTDILEYPGFYVMDVLYGLNFMSITCDQIVPVKMGYEFKERLILCPVQLSNRHITRIISFAPKNCVRSLRPGIIRSMHFKVEDLNGEKLYFNGGKVVIICNII